MESGMMKVVFSSIINGSQRELPSNEAKSGRSESAASQENRFKPEIRYSPAKEKPVGYQEKTSCEVFASLINASNCANLYDEKVLDGYVTVTSGSSILRKNR
jgi:hypothetical protein